MTSESERVRWAVTPRYVRIMDTAADGWPPLFGVVVLMLVMGAILASAIVAWREIVQDGLRSFVVLACVFVVFLASLWGLIDRMVVMPWVWRRQRGGDAIDSAWRNWRAKSMGWVQQPKALHAARDVARLTQPGLVAIAADRYQLTLQPFTGLPLLDPDSVRGRLPTSIWVYVGTAVGLVATCAAPAVLRQGATPLASCLACGLGISCFVIGSYFGNRPVRLSLGSGVVEAQGKRWTVENSLLLVTRNGFFNVRATLVGPLGTLATTYRSAKDPGLQSLWAHWTTSVPRLDLPAVVE